MTLDHATLRPLCVFYHQTLYSCKSYDIARHGSSKFWNHFSHSWFSSVPAYGARRACDSSEHRAQSLRPLCVPMSHTPQLSIPAPYLSFFRIKHEITLSAIVPGFSQSGPPPPCVLCVRPSGLISVISPFVVARHLADVHRSCISAGGGEAPRLLKQVGRMCFQEGRCLSDLQL